MYLTQQSIIYNVLRPLIWALCSSLFAIWKDRHVNNSNNFDTAHSFYLQIDIAMSGTKWHVTC